MQKVTVEFFEVTASSQQFNFFVNCVIAPIGKLAIEQAARIIRVPFTVTQIPTQEKVAAWHVETRQVVWQQTLFCLQHHGTNALFQLRRHSFIRI